MVVIISYHEKKGADIARFLRVSEANVQIIRHVTIRQFRECMVVV